MGTLALVEASPPPPWLAGHPHVGERFMMLVILAANSLM